MRRSKELVLGMALAVCVLAMGCSETPQLGRDEASWTTADALWTAITAKNPSLLQECSERLDRLESAGKLAPETAAALQSLIQEARNGDWDDARKDLKVFVQGQRRPA